MKSWHMVALTMAGAVGVLAVVFAVVPKDKPAAVPVKNVGEPVGKIDADDLVQWYERNDGPHEWEGKPILVKFVGGLYYGPDSDGNVAAQFHCDNGFRRPNVVLHNGNKWQDAKPGTVGFHHEVVGVLRGVKHFEKESYAREWLKLTPGLSQPRGGFVLLTEFR